MEEEKKVINIKKVIASKNKALARILPGFIIQYFKKILHEDELNQILYDNRNYEGIDFVKKNLDAFEIDYVVHGEKNIPTEGRYIFISNHPLGGLDGLILMNEVSQYLNNFKFIVNDILMNIPNLSSIFVPVNKHGRQNIEYARKIEDAYASDSQILYFPAGLCSRKIKGTITDLDWKKNFLLKAVKHQRDIVPIYFSGKNSNFFYNLANIRKRFGIKANIEMFFLVDELFKQKNKKLDLYFGQPIPFGTFSKDKNYQKWVSLLREHVYHLPENPDRPFPAFN